MESADFEAALAALPEGYSEGIYGGSQRRADKWTVIWACAALMLRAGPRQRRGLFHDERVADSERF
jgi:hypothetical protein